MSKREKIHSSKPNSVSPQTNNPQDIEPPNNKDCKHENVIKRLYLWVLGWAETKYGLPMLCIIAFTESSFFPIPPDVLLIPLVLGSLSKWWKTALWCSISSVLGGMLGYWIGAAAWDPMGLWIVTKILHLDLVEINGRLDIPLPTYLINMFGSELGGEFLFQAYDKWNAWIVFIFGMTPLPYKLVTISAGVAQVNFAVFVVASIAARAGRFFLVAWILRKWGEIAKRYIERYFNIVVIIFTLLLIGSFVLIKVILK